MLRNVAEIQAEINETEARLREVMGRFVNGRLLTDDEQMEVAYLRSKSARLFDEKRVVIAAKNKRRRG